MTILAAQRFMDAEQGEVGSRVSEMIRIQPGDVRITAFMVGMTAAAVDRAVGGHTSVEAQPGTEVRIDFLVAVQAHGCLISLVEAHMTFVAVTFEFGVALDDLARHQQQLAQIESGVLSLGTGEAGKHSYQWQQPLQTEELSVSATARKAIGEPRVRPVRMDGVTAVFCSQNLIFVHFNHKYVQCKLRSHKKASP